MKALIEQKIKQLQDEVKSIRNLVFQESDSISKLEEQRDLHELQLQKLYGAIEAFQSTVNAINDQEKKESQVKDKVDVEPKDI